MPTLGVNIDHIATIRQARKTVEPDPVVAAVLAELKRADGITVHLREDRRHIQDRDVRLLRQTVRTHSSWNVYPVSCLPGMEELNIGHTIISRAALVGLERAVREMKQAMRGEF